MMKIGWLVWEDEEDELPTLVPENSWRLDAAWRKVRIAYIETV